MEEQTKQSLIRESIKKSVDSATEELLVEIIESGYIQNIPDKFKSLSTRKEIIAIETAKEYYSKSKTLFELADEQEVSLHQVCRQIDRALYLIKIDAPSAQDLWIEDDRKRAEATNLLNKYLESKLDLLHQTWFRMREVTLKYYFTDMIFQELGVQYGNISKQRIQKIIQETLSIFQK